MRGIAAEIQALWHTNRVALTGGIILLLVIMAALAAPLLTAYSPEQADLLSRDLAPAPDHWMGTDQLGRDIWSRLLYGARLSLAVAAGAVLAAGSVGLCAGAIAGYKRGWIGGLLMRLADMMLALPTFFLLIAVQTILRPGIFNIIFVIALTGWMFPARLIYGQFLSLRERDFVLAARSLGASDRRIVLKHLLPQTQSTMLVYITLAAADAILLEAALSFLGLGVPPYQASWGTMLNDAQNGIFNGFWWATLFPGLAILLTTLAANLFGEGLREWLGKGN